MILALAGRGFGPLATLLLLAYLADFPSAYTAQFAILAAYMQLSTAPLNPYAEHFHLRELMSGRQGGYKAGLTGLALLWITSSILVLALGQSLLILAIVPLLGIGHLMLKVIAARLRANRRNSFAVALEFSLRPVALLALTVIIFIAVEPSVQSLKWAFGLTGVGTIIAAIVVYLFINGAHIDSKNINDSGPVTKPSSPGAFVLLGMLMVLTAQFEIFVLDYFASDEELATYKVALQLASVCGIATNFILLHYLRELYAHEITSNYYRRVFRKVQIQTLGISLFFVMSFVVVALLHPYIWSRDVWILAAIGAFILSLSAAFGPVGNWLYAAGHLKIIMVSLSVMLFVKIILIFGIYFNNKVSPFSLMFVFGVGTLTHNIIMYKAKNYTEKYFRAIR